MAKHKTIQLKLGIGINDLERKMAQASSFLTKGSSVKITLLLHGRQKGNPSQGVKFLESIARNYMSEYKPSSKPTEQNLSLFYNPPKKD